MRISRSPKPARGRPPTGEALTAAERMRRMRERRKAAGLKAVVSWRSAQAAPTSAYSGHRVLDIRSLAMHAVIAQKIERDPSLLAIARANLQRWRERKAGSTPAWLEEWQEILRLPWPDIATIITAPDENATRLRQSSPFAGVLTSAERKKIYDALRA